MLPQIRRARGSHTWTVDEAERRDLDDFPAHRPTSFGMPAGRDAPRATARLAGVSRRETRVTGSGSHALKSAFSRERLITSTSQAVGLTEPNMAWYSALCTRDSVSLLVAVAVLLTVLDSLILGTVCS